MSGDGSSYMTGRPISGGEIFTALQLDPVSGRYRKRWTTLDELVELARLRIAAGDTAGDLRRDQALAELAARDRAHEAAIAAGAARDDAQDRVTAQLAARPEEVVAFTATITPGLVSIGGKTLTVTGLAGLKKDERLSVEPADALPAGIAIAYARAPADATVEIRLSAVAAVSLAQLSLLITALR